MDKQIVELAHKIAEKTISRRRDFHRYAETAWTEFRTASVVADVLTKLGYEVYVADAVMDRDARMGVPSETELARHYERAVAQGANPLWVEKMRGGMTGVVGVMRFGRPGPVVAMRFDMDANDAYESADDKHRPVREKFASVNEGAMHACAHDAHAAVGLAIAEILAHCNENMAGTVKLIFQPAEEGGRGAKCMVAKGVVDDVDAFVGMHFGLNVRKTGAVACQSEGFLVSTKADALFTGTPAHAGAAPEEGRNAVLAAAAATLNLHAISRHSKGASRINVGVIQGGSGRNVIPANAMLKMETRGATEEINNYMYAEAMRIIEAAAAMQGVELAIQIMGETIDCENNPELAEKIGLAAAKTGLFSDIMPSCNLGGGEDCTFFMRRVREHGGQAAYITVGTELAAGHHNFRFDINEDALIGAVALMAQIAADILAESF